MTTPPNDWAKLSEELEEVKRAAYHQGYQKAIDDFGSSKTKFEEQARQLDEQIRGWSKIIHEVREAWSKETGEPARWMDPEKDKYRYQLMFGHTSNRLGAHYYNMPEDVDGFIHAMAEVTKMAADFKMLLAEFEKNPIVKAQWDRLLVAMRMTEQ
jgi:hypothetical protein